MVIQDEEDDFRFMVDDEEMFVANNCGEEYFVVLWARGKAIGEYIATHTDGCLIVEWWAGRAFLYPHYFAA